MFCYEADKSFCSTSHNHWTQTRYCGKYKLPLQSYTYCHMQCYVSYIIQCKSEFVYYLSCLFCTATGVAHYTGFSALQQISARLLLASKHTKCTVMCLNILKGRFSFICSVMNNLKYYAIY